MKEQEHKCKCPFCNNELMVCCSETVFCEPCKINFIRCKGCGQLFNANFERCPECGKPVIDEPLEA